MIEIDGIKFELVEERKDAYREEAIQERWNDVLNRYDFIVGDWGFEKLRLKGFFDDKDTRSTFENKSSTIREYILEYCNFGCPYFILKRVDK